MKGNAVREFYASLEGPVVVGIEATEAMQWFLELREALGVVSGRRSSEDSSPRERKQMHDRRALTSSTVVEMLALRSTVHIADM